MWELDHKEGWVPKNCCFQIVVLEKTLESPLHSKIKPVNPKWNQSWIFIGRADTETEAPILWPPDAKSQLIGKDPDAGKDWGQEKRATEHETVGWHHWLNGHEFEQTPGEGEGQGSLACCCPWGHKESDTSEWLNNNKKLNSVFAEFSSFANILGCIALEGKGIWGVFCKRKKEGTKRSQDFPRSPYSLN